MYSKSFNNNVLTVCESEKIYHHTLLYYMKFDSFVDISRIMLLYCFKSRGAILEFLSIFFFLTSVIRLDIYRFFSFDIHILRVLTTIFSLFVIVKKIRIIPQRKKLRATSSYRSIYMQVGAEYVRHVSTMLKSRINTLKATSFPVAPEGLKLNFSI